MSRWLSAAGLARAGGDWCEVMNLSHDLVALTIGDVCGHGDSAAPTMTVLRAATCGAMREDLGPVAILASLNELIWKSGDGITVTAIVAFIDRRRRTLTFANAGHPPPFLIAGDSAGYLENSPGDLPLGIFASHPWTEYVIAMPERALLALYTDGMTEHHRDAIRGERDFARACRYFYERTDDDTARAIAERVFRKGLGRDDAALVTVRTIRVERLSPRPIAEMDAASNIAGVHRHVASSSLNAPGFRCDPNASD